MSKKNEVTIPKNFFDSAAIHSYEEVTKIIPRQETSSVIEFYPMISTNISCLS